MTFQRRRTIITWIRHLLSKIKDAGNNKILNTNRKNTLTNLLQKKSYTDDKSALKRYFDKWRQYNTLKMVSAALGVVN